MASPSTSPTSAPDSAPTVRALLELIELPIVYSVFSFIALAASFIIHCVSYCAYGLIGLISSLFHPVYGYRFSPLPLIISSILTLTSTITYILAPLTFFFFTLLSILVLTPYAILEYFLDAIYPVYVFCGVACITGVLVGVAARWAVGVIVLLGEDGMGERASSRFISEAWGTKEEKGRTSITRQEYEEVDY